MSGDTLTANAIADHVICCLFRREICQLGRRSPLPYVGVVLLAPQRSRHACRALSFERHFSSIELSCLSAHPFGHGRTLHTRMELNASRTAAAESETAARSPHLMTVE